jgi:hypothetical protein
MRIRTAIGVGVMIVVLKFLVPKIFVSFEGVTVALFDTFRDILIASRTNLPPSH